MNIEKIQAKIQKAISRFPSAVTVKRTGLNDFGEPAGEESVCEVTGFFHKGNQRITLEVNIAGSSTAKSDAKLMVVLDDTAKLIREDDYFDLAGKKYKVVDLNYQYGIYADMVLEEIAWESDSTLAESYVAWQKQI